MLLEKFAKFLYKMAETWRKYIENCHLFGCFSYLEIKKRILGIMNFQKKSRNGNEKKIFKRIWWPNFGKKCRNLHQNSGKLTLIPNSSRPILTFFYGKVFEVKWCQRWKMNILNNKFQKKI